MIGWHHRLQWTWVWVNSGVGDGQGGLACCSPWGHQESDMTERLNWTELLPASGRSLVTESGDYSLVVVCGLLIAAVSLVVEHRLQAHQLSVCSSRSLERRLGICGTGAQVLCSMWDSPGPGIEPVSPAKPGRLLPFVPPRKPGLPTFCQQWVN